MRALKALMLLSVTGALALRAQAPAALKCGLPLWAQQTRRAALRWDRGLSYLNLSLVSPRGLFRIHYTLTGSDAVDTTEWVDGHPRFVVETALAAEKAYALLVDSLGFMPPVSDNGEDGPELDIYIKNWGGLVYAYTNFTQAGQPTYMVIDNDYREVNYSTHGLDALRVTVAHEFFHMVQLRYAAPLGDRQDDVFLFELCSVWFEDKCYPEVNDYVNYVPYVLNSNPTPPINSNSNAMYGAGLFAKILDRFYGIGNGKHIILDLWEHFAQERALPALHDVLEQGPWHSSLGEALSLYGLLNCFSGRRAAPFSYSDAALFPTPPDSQITLLAVYPQDYQLPAIPLRVSYYSFSPVSFDSLYLIKSDFVPAEIVAQSGVYWSTESAKKLGAVGNFYLEAGAVDVGDQILVIVANGQESTAGWFPLRLRGRNLPLSLAIQRLFPSPVGTGETVTLDVTLPYSDVVTIQLYDLLGRRLLKSAFDLSKGIHLLPLSLPSDLATGLYLVGVQTSRQNIGATLIITRKSQ